MLKALHMALLSTSRVSLTLNLIVILFTTCLVEHQLTLLAFSLRVAAQLLDSDHFASRHVRREINST